MNEIIFTIVRYALEGDTERVKVYGLYLADRLDEDGEENTARRLREIISAEDGNVIKPKGTT